MFQGFRRPDTLHGLLSYSTFNLGDQIQSLAARRFLPSVDCYMDREALDQAKGEPGRVKLIMNGWYCHRPDRWPPSSAIDPLLVSFHVSDIPGDGSGLRARDVFARSDATRDWLRQHGPVGARDLSTLEYLRGIGVEAYFSGCLTLTLRRPEGPRDAGLVLCDVPDTVVQALEDRGIVGRRTCHRDEKTKGQERFDSARALLALYARATWVVTTRLHCALPCLAMGTPVLLLDTAADIYRFSGLSDLVHHRTVEQFLDELPMFDADAPLANPRRHLELQQALIETAERFARSRKGWRRLLPTLSRRQAGGASSR